MPDTPGKRQRREVKAKRRQAKDERRDARKARRQDRMPRPGDEQTEDQRGLAGEREDHVGGAQPDDPEDPTHSGEIV